MKENIKVILLTFIVTVFTVSLFFQNHVNPQNLSLYSIYAQAIDSESGEVLNATYHNPKLKLENTSKGNKVFVEFFSHNESCKITWIDFKNQTSEIKVSKDGYHDHIISANAIRELNSTTIETRDEDKPLVIKMEKIKK